MPLGKDTNEEQAIPPMERIIESIRHAPSSRVRATSIIAGLIGFIGVVDYFVDVSVSLIFFYTVPIALAVLWGNKFHGVIASLICIFVRTAGDLIAGGYFFPMETVVWNRLTNFANYLMTIYAVEAIASIHNRLERKVARRTLELEKVIQSRNELQAQLFEVSRRERISIGHELHDELCQQLAAATFAMDLLTRDLRKTAHSGEEIATAVQGILRTSISQTKEIAYNLLSSEVKPDKLISSLHEMSERLGRKSGHPINFTHEIEGPAPDTVTSSHIFYIAQEATLNAVKHARAAMIDIKLTIVPNRLTLKVSDNGVGLTSTAPSEHSMGLRIMNHRASLIGGNLEIHSRAHEGTTIACCVDLAT